MYTVYINSTLLWISLHSSRFSSYETLGILLYVHFLVLIVAENFVVFNHHILFMHSLSHGHQDCLWLRRASKVIIYESVLSFSLGYIFQSQRLNIPSLTVVWHHQFHQLHFCPWAKRVSVFLYIWLVLILNLWWFDEFRVLSSFNVNLFGYWWNCVLIFKLVSNQIFPFIYCFFISFTHFSFDPFLLDF
jgi:hypothetical protein